MPTLTPAPSEKIKIYKRMRQEPNYGPHITHHVDFPITEKQQGEMIEFIHNKKESAKYELVDETV